MALEIIDQGQDNMFLADDAQALNGQLIFRGSNSRVRIGKAIKPGRFHFTVHSGCSIDIAPQLINGALRLHLDSGGHVSIGPECGINGSLSISVPEPSTVSIGRGCLFADGISMLTSDHHGIFDRASRRRINLARNIDIGARVWVGSAALILKGATIGRGSVIGAHAVVGGKIQEFCAAAGNPARIIRRNVTWDGQLLNEMPAALEDMAAFETPAPAPWPAASPALSPPPAAAAAPGARLLRALIPTFIKHSMEASSTQAEADKRHAPAGAVLAVMQLGEIDDYWLIGDATLQGAAVPAHIALAYKQHWELLR